MFIKCKALNKDFAHNLIRLIIICQVDKLLNNEVKEEDRTNQISRITELPTVHSNETQVDTMVSKSRF